jgi:hypothetical protein
MTRHPGRSSFTFEIKRANRPTSEALARRTASVIMDQPLADQVFSKRAISSTRLQLDGVPTAHARSGPLGPKQGESVAVDPTPPASPRRILPDLSSAPPNPVEERLRREAEERAARRRTARRVRAGEGQGTSLEPISNIAAQGGAPGESASPLADSRPLAAEPLAAPEKTELAREPAKALRPRGTSRLKAAARRAQRKGLPAPRLPAGSRWKRRLDWTCW